MIGEQIRYFRKKSGLSQKNLASRLFVSQQAVGKWERDEATPNPEAIVKMSAIFGISTDALLGQVAVSTDDAQNDIKAAFFEGAEDLPPEEMDALWEDAREYLLKFCSWLLIVFKKEVRMLKLIRALRIKKGLSAKKLADLMEITPQAVGKWERGEANPSAAQLPVLADLLGCTIDALFGRDDQDSA